MPNLVQCSICNLKFHRLSALLRHVKITHRSDPRFSLKCSICGMVSRSFRTFYSHVNKIHNKLEKSIDEDLSFDTNLDKETAGIHESDLAVEAAKSVLYLKEVGLLTEASTNRIIEHMEDIVELHLEKVKIKLKQSGIPLDNLHDVLKCDSTFLKLRSQTQREQTFQTLFKMQSPKPVLLGTSLMWMKKKAVPELKEVKAEGYIFPFLLTLKRIMLHKDFKRALRPSSSTIPGIFKDVIDGSFYKNHPILCQENAIAIVAYYDDVEIANPLGSKSKQHKLGVFYWFIANIDPAYRSQLSSINLLAIAKTKHIRKHGVTVLFADFISSLTILENRYNFEHGGNTFVVKGALLAFPSDTLASNFIGGFKEAPSFSYSPCRLCLVKSSSMKTIYDEKNVCIRDSGTYKEQLAIVENKNISMQAHTYWSKMFGIVNRSVLGNVPYFDVTKCFVLDIMHVFFEGIVLNAVQLLLLHCFEKKYVTSLYRINNRMKILSFIGASTADCPIELDLKIIRDPNRKLRQNAAQSWQLAIMLPFLIDEHVPSDDKNYDNFLDLLKILNMCVSFVISLDGILVLKQLISIYLSNFVELYGNVRLTPKMHYLVHLPRQIEMFGPPRHLWCFRFEAKHLRLKRTAAVSCNFKNICLTVAKRFESLACLELTHSSNFLVKETKLGITSQVCSLPDYVTLIVDINAITEAKYIILNSIKYKCGYYLLYSMIEDTLPTFILIRHIYTVNNNCIYLTCENQKNLKYNKRLQFIYC